SSSDPINIYDSLGLYYPQLIAISSQGCRDTADGFVNVLIPVVDIAIMDVEDRISGNEHRLSATLINLGNVEISSFSIRAQLQSNGVLVENWNGKLAPNQTLQYDFGSGLFNWNQTPQFFCIDVDLAPAAVDEDLSNNKLCESLTGDFDILQVFPNPFTDNFTVLIQSAVNGEVIIDIYDVVGRQLMESYSYSAVTGINELRINSQHFGTGLYFLKARQEDQEREIMIFKN
ncbi:MAG: T9SS type A sorting domain-containing protein, partial [Bacteroidia bacterium]|nr:T9SS type A sorting domain-containing protein [Bacteroidia bacterium]